MSVVVAIRHENQVYLGCDSQASSSKSKYTLTNQNNFKIWAVKGCEKKCMIGAVGSLRDTNILRIQKKLVDELALIKGEINFDYVVENLVPRLMVMFEDHDRLRVDDGRKYMGISIIFAYESRIYEISPDGGVVEVDDYTAIGSGDDIALGSLNTSEELLPVERIIKAIEASAKTNLYVNYPIVIGSTTSSEITLIESENNKTTRHLVHV